MQFCSPSHGLLYNAEIVLCVLKKDKSYFWPNLAKISFCQVSWFDINFCYSLYSFLVLIALFLPFEVW